MRSYHTNEFKTVNGGSNNKNKVLLIVSAVIIALLAIAAAVMMSVIMNMNQNGTPPPSVITDTDDTSAPPEDYTTSAPDTTAAPETTVSILPGNDTTAPTTSTSEPKKLPSKVDGKYTICIDPGHGYDDHGAGSEFLGDVRESEIVMDISNYLKDYLIELGYNVVMTHENNIPPAGTYGQYLFNFKTRIAYVNEKFDYDYYISIHCNSYPEEYVNGCRIYYHAPSGANNSVIAYVAECMKNGIASALPGSKTPTTHPMDTADAYYVCKHAKSLASLLIETGFVTNRSDAEKMLDDTWKKDMAKGMATGINTYLSGLN